MARVHAEQGAGGLELETALQFGHALLGEGMPQAVGAAAPAEGAERGAREAAAPRLAAGDVVARGVADFPVGDADRLAEAALLTAPVPPLRSAHSGHLGVVAG